MKIPQLVQEIIDYYLYLAKWKARTKQLHEEYNKKVVKTCYDIVKINYFSYNDRNLSLSTHNIQYVYIFNHKTYPSDVAKLPSRYFYSNTKEQLKSLYF